MNKYDLKWTYTEQVSDQTFAGHCYYEFRGEAKDGSFMTSFTGWFAPRAVANLKQRLGAKYMGQVQMAKAEAIA